MTTLIKLGGSLVTDKRKPKSFRRTAVKDIALQLIELRSIQPDRRIVLGHGSGSFGHFEAQKHDTMRGLHSAADRMGFARVGAVASELGHLILEELLAAGLPALRFPPAAMQVARNREVAHLDIRALALALNQQFLPLVNGDVALDEAIGGSIISTEKLFAHLVKPLKVKRILLLGNSDGVLDQNNQVIPRLTAENVKCYEHVLGTAEGFDVTGGMNQKVKDMLRLVILHKDLDIHIANGNQSGLLLDILKRGANVGTRISAI